MENRSQRYHSYSTRLVRLNDRFMRARNWHINPSHLSRASWETALTQQRDMVMKELALASVCSVLSIPLRRSLVFRIRSICRGILFRMSEICGRYSAAFSLISVA